MGPRTLNVSRLYMEKRTQQPNPFSSILESSVLTHKYFFKELDRSDLNNYESVSFVVIT